jgi:ABC-2 type transport system ATP-binding protein
VYRVRLKGGSDPLRAQVAAQPWASAVGVETAQGYSTWSVTVSDENAAEDQLLRLLLADPAVRIAEYGLQKYELEEVFLNIVEDSEHGRK